MRDGGWIPWRMAALVGVALSTSSARAGAPAPCTKLAFKTGSCVLKSTGSLCEKKDFKQERCVVPSGELRVESLSFGGPALRKAAAPRIGSFFEIDADQTFAETDAGLACAPVLAGAGSEIASGTRAPGHGGLTPSKQSVCDAAGGNAVGGSPPGWGSPGEDWARYGVYFNAFSGSLRAGVGPWKVEVGVGATSVAFQAWRQIGAHARIGDAAYLASAHALNVCCQANGCGDFAVRGWDEWEQYACSYSGLKVDLDAKVAHYDVGGGIRTDRGTSTKDTWTVLEVVPLPDKAATIQEACLLTEQVVLPANDSLKHMFYCPVGGLNPVVVSGNAVVIRDVTEEDGLWSLVVDTRARGTATIAYARGREHGGATQQITLADSGTEVPRQAALVDTAALVERLASDGMLQGLPAKLDTKTLKMALAAQFAPQVYVEEPSPGGGGSWRKYPVAAPEE